MNPLGDPQEFALVLPVPTVLAESDIKTLDAAIFQRLDGYTAPRHVPDAGCGGSGSTTSDGGGAGGSGSGDAAGTVDVEATYLVGGYEIVILSAEESAALQAWLDSHGYHLPDGAEERLAEYIEAGSLFLAAKVAPEAAVASGDALLPLQIHYQSDIFMIPIRPATLNSPGEQDMIVYALTELLGDAAAGTAGIANSPEFDAASTCRWQEDRGFAAAGAWTAVSAGG